jgi:hypothetical protein
MQRKIPPEGVWLGGKLPVIASKSSLSKHVSNIHTCLEDISSVQYISSKHSIIFYGKNKRLNEGWEEVGRRYDLFHQSHIYK